jgi:MoaA/NifB/PqqE/SkfB family radical SAM enzyme
VTLVCNYYLTLKCNDTCEFSRLWQKKEFQEMEEVGAEAVKKNLRYLRDMGVLVMNFTGGEPLLYEDLPEVLRASKRLGFFNILTTNGILYPEKADLITNLVNHLVFSLDSPSPSEHNRIRGIDCFRSVIDGIKTAKRLGKSPIINFTVTKDTIGVLPDMVDLSQKLGVLLWINPVYNWFGLEGFSKDSVDYISRYFGRKNVGLNLASLQVIRDGGNNTRRPVCRAGSSTVTVFPDNTLVSPCIHLQRSVVKLDDNIAGILKRREVKLATSIHGRDEKCKGCMDWSYLNPSFFRGINKNLFLALYSMWSLFWKELRLKPAGSQAEKE